MITHGGQIRYCPQCKADMPTIIRKGWFLGGVYCQAGHYLFNNRPVESAKQPVNPVITDAAESAKECLRGLEP